MDEVERLAKEHRPKLLLAGWSAYPRALDFAALPRDRRRGRRAADGRHGALRRPRRGRACTRARSRTPTSSPRTVHKTLGGPRSGLILCREEYAKKINSAVFPGQQGGPLEHAIAAKAVAFKIAASELFKERQRAHRRRRPGAGRGAAAPARRQRADRRHRRPPRARRPARLRARRPAGRGSAALDRDHGQPQRGAVRPAPADGHQRPARSARPRWPPAACRPTTSTRSARSSPARCSRTSRPRAAS